MDDQERLEILEKERKMLDMRYRSMKRELEQLDLIFKEIKSVRIAELRMRYATVMGLITNLLRQNSMERGIVEGRKRENEEIGNVV